MSWITITDDEDSWPQPNQPIIGCDAISGMIRKGYYSAELDMIILEDEEVEPDACVTHWFPIEMPQMEEDEDA